MFLVVVSLGWWINVRDPCSESKVGDAIADVTWVVDNLVSILSANATSPAPQPAPLLPLPQNHNGNVLGQPRPALQQSASVRESGVRISSISHRRDHSPIILLSLATSFYLSHE